MREVYISTAFLFALRQSAGETPAIRWSCLHFRIAGGTSAILLTIFCNKKLRFATGSAASCLNYDLCDFCD
ncbi:MAG: hypothetical protein LBP59_07990 [Planctomycetaceae bacterium]|nr:hypothetical protein [Planctomycetaceae bacterium]